MNIILDPRRIFGTDFEMFTCWLDSKVPNISELLEPVDASAQHGPKRIGANTFYLSKEFLELLYENNIKFITYKKMEDTPMEITVNWWFYIEIEPDTGKICKFFFKGKDQDGNNRIVSHLACKPGKGSNVKKLEHLPWYNYLTRLKKGQKL